jgi:hypothetical protein
MRQGMGNENYFKRGIATPRNPSSFQRGRECIRLCAGGKSRGISANESLAFAGMTAYFIKRDKPPSCGAGPYFL